MSICYNRNKDKKEEGDEMNYHKIVRKLNADRGRENRKNGEAFEFRVLRKYKRRSDVLWAIRSAGSHSLVDIVVQFKNKRQYWITCKKNGYTEPKEERAVEILKLNVPSNVKLLMYYYKSPKKMAYTEL